MMKSAPRWIAWILYVAAVVMIVGGAVTWSTVSSQLADQKITVTPDASCQQNAAVTGPLQAYCMAEVINKHSLEATGGKTYAELGKTDPLRATAQTASFLQASLYTSVVAFGVAAMAIGLGILVALVGFALQVLYKRSTPAAEAAAAPPTTTAQQ